MHSKGRGTDGKNTLRERIEKANKYFERFRRDGVLNQVNDHSVVADDGRTAFNVISQVDLEIIAKASQYSLVCFGEGFMHDASMMFGVLGGENDKGEAEFRYRAGESRYAA